MCWEKFLLTLTLISLPLSAIRAQYAVTENPSVRYDNESWRASEKITKITLTENFTFVFLTYITNKNLRDGWISMSSSATITDNSGKTLSKIIDWGIYYDNEPHILNLDERYAVTNDRRYDLVLIFGDIPNGITTININENIGESSFYWLGIQINNPSQHSPTQRYSSSKTHKIEDSYSATRSKSNDSPSYSFPKNQSPGAPEQHLETPEKSFHANTYGSGFAVSSNGVIATCFHVIENASDIRIRGINGNFDTPLKADLIYQNKERDIALLKITDKQFSSIGVLPYTITSSTIETGDDVYILGYPLRPIMGDEIKLTTGIVSSKTGYMGDETSYQVSATAQTGNSGGPLFSKNGEVVGIVNARLIVESATYAIKSPYLGLALREQKIQSPYNASLIGKSLSEQVKAVQPFVYIIEVETF